MTRVVLDTNILVSALLQPLGPSAQLFLRCLNGSLQLCLTGPIFAEYEEVISRPHLGRSLDVIAAMVARYAFWRGCGRRLKFAAPKMCPALAL
jgi:putative PIN family toxin of toxin-antitoxin system